jgi:hypothetical protein
MSESRADKFPIFTDEELKVLHSEQMDPAIKKYVHDLADLLDNWVAPLETGWYVSLKKILNDKYPEKLDLAIDRKLTLKLDNIKLGLNKYLTTCYLLKNRFAFKTVGADQPLFYYDEFWKNCYNQLISSNLTKVIKNDKSIESKILIYGLWKFKEQTLSTLNINIEHVIKLQEEIDRSVKKFFSTQNAVNKFILTSDEIKKAGSVCDSIMINYYKLLSVEKAFGSNTLYADYIHIRPAILIQLAGLLDFVIQKINDTQHSKNTSYLRYASQYVPNVVSSYVSKYTPTAISQFWRTESNKWLELRILEKKRKDIAEMMQFQEQLLLMFQSDDFLDVLHTLIENKDTSLLPEKDFFKFESMQVFTISHSSLPESKISDLKNISFLRRQYISLYAGAGKKEIVPIPLDELTEWQNKQEDLKHSSVDDQAIPLSLVGIADPATCSINEIFIPRIIVAGFRIEHEAATSSSSLFRGFFAKSIGESNNNLYDYFIHHSENRRFFYINKIGSLVKYFHNLEATKASYEDLIFDEKIKVNCNLLIESLKALDNELDSAESAMKNMSSNDRPFMSEYIDFVKIKKESFCNITIKSYDYFVEKIKNINPSDIPKVTILNRSLKKLIKYFNDDKRLMDFEKNVIGNKVLEDEENYANPLLKHYRTQAKN